MWKPSLWKSLTILFPNLALFIKFKKEKQKGKWSLVSLGLLHLGHVGAAILVQSGAVGGAVVDALAILVVLPVGVDGRAVLTLFNVLLGQPLTLHVRLDPEVGEEHKEEGSVHPDKVDYGGELVVTAVHEVILSSVEWNQDKLDLSGGIRRQVRTVGQATPSEAIPSRAQLKSAYQLNSSHVFLPPQKLLEARACGREAVVEIHDDVDGGVHHGVERPHSTCGIKDRDISAKHHQDSRGQWGLAG